MTPIPRPTRPRNPGYIYVTDPLQMSSSRRAVWRAPYQRMNVTDEQIDDALAASAAQLGFYDLMQATAQAGEPDDEPDAGYLAAIRLAPRRAGPHAGWVPVEVARRLFAGGWVERVDA